MSPYLPGDILLFSGPWSDRTSRWIKLATLSRWTHVAVCVRITRRALERMEHRLEQLLLPPLRISPHSWPDDVYLAESTTLCDLPCMIQQDQVAGVQIHPVTARIESYRGMVALRRLKTPLDPEWGSLLLTHRVLGSLGTPYDYSGAGLSATRAVKYLFGLGKANDTHEMFCSEFVLDVLQFALNGYLKRRVVSGAAPPRVLAGWEPTLYDPPKVIQEAA